MTTNEIKPSFLLYVLKRYELNFTSNEEIIKKMKDILEIDIPIHKNHKEYGNVNDWEEPQMIQHIFYWIRRSEDNSHIDICEQIKQEGEYGMISKIAEYIKDKHLKT